MKIGIVGCGFIGTELAKIIDKSDSVLVGINDISQENIFYLNLEELKILETLNENPENLLDYITNSKERNYFFLDENLKSWKEILGLEELLQTTEQ